MYDMDIKHPSKKLQYRTVNKNNGMVVRDVVLPGTVDGIYNQLLFDLCSPDSLIALSLFGSYNPAIDAIGVSTSQFDNIHQDMITYVAADGAAAASATSGRQTDPCADANTIESGGCAFSLSGWGRLRRESPGRDITNENMRYCQRQPIYDIAGMQIDNDYEWDIIRVATVILQDFHRELIVGSNAIGGSADGLEQLVNYGYQDPDTSELCTSMDSTVVNWNGNAMCDPAGATAVTVNGAAIADGYDLLDIIKAFLRQTQTRIQMSSLSGIPFHMALATTNDINCLIDCYVCDVQCGGDIEQMNTMEARQMITQLRQNFGANNAIVLSFEGYPVLFYAWDWELEDSITGNSDMYILTPRVGNQKLIDIQLKNMDNAVSATERGTQEFKVTDGGRFLHWEEYTKTCYKTTTEMQWRVYMPAPWAQMRITNVSCSGPLQTISPDPLSSAFIEGNLVAHSEV